MGKFLEQKRVREEQQRKIMQEEKKKTESKSERFIDYKNYENLLNKNKKKYSIDNKEDKVEGSSNSNSGSPNESMLNKRKISSLVIDKSFSDEDSNIVKEEQE